MEKKTRKTKTESNRREAGTGKDTPNIERRAIENVKERVGGSGK